MAYYHCVPYMSEGLFSLCKNRVVIPMVAKGRCLGLVKLRDRVTLEPHT